MKDFNRCTHKKYNAYNLSGEYGIGYTLKNEPFYFDLEDYGKIKDYCWYVNSEGYLKAKNKNNRIISMHRLLMNCPEELLVDHINHNVKDNRKCNLRIVDRSQNQMNSTIRSRNSSGIVGVSFDISKNLWTAHIGCHNQRYSKCFRTKEEAIVQRKAWEEEFFGEYSYNNSMKLQNNT